ncbi:MAG: hypothetical protein HC767_06495 [Akkermansiaceae bacterium]|nr:hypothetical protein [Akkermansiaceae bacterium]
MNCSQTGHLWGAVPADSKESSGAVRIAAWHPSKDLLATGSSDGKVTVWDAKSGELMQELHSCELPQEPVTAIAWKPDGLLLAAGSDDNTVRLWNAATGVLERHLIDANKGHSAAVSAVAWHPEGNVLVSGSLDGSAKVWNAAEGGLGPDEGAIIDELGGHGGAVTSIAFTPCARYVLTTCDDGHVRIYRRSWQVAPAEREECFDWGKYNSKLHNIAQAGALIAEQVKVLCD